MASACVLIDCPVTGRVLAVSRKDNHSDFGLPGGHVEPGEPEKAAAVRELREETGLVVDENMLEEVFRRQGGVTYRLRWPLTGGIKVALPRAAGETGTVDWVHPESLFRGSFGDYNLRLFASLGRIHRGGC